jgi:SOS-response transcriptional repressor LexA
MLVDICQEIWEPKDMNSEFQNTDNELKSLVESAEVKAGSVKKLAEMLDVSTKTIYNWKNNVRFPERDNWLKMKDFVGESSGTGGVQLPALQASGCTHQEPEYYKVPYVEARPAGDKNGSLILEAGVRSYLAFSSPWIHSKGSPSHMKAFKVMGDSMGPAIPDGSVVLVDESRKEFVNGKIYIVSHDQGLKIKRVRWEDDQYVLYSDDGITDPQPIAADEYFKIEGRVIWTAHEVP